MKRVRNWLLAGIAAAMCAVLLSGCGPAEQQETEIIEEQTEEVEEYICAIEDSEVRRILRFRVMGTRAMSQSIV